MNENRYQIVQDEILGPIYFPENDSVIAPHIEKFGVWEPLEVKWIHENVKSGMTCLNVGANVGYFTIHMAKLVGETGQVHSVEPNSEVRKYLKLNIQKRILSNVSIYKFAAGERNSLGVIYLNQRNYGDSRMFDPRKTTGGGEYKFHGFAKVPKRRVVRIKSIDKVIKENIDVVLIDTQGFDHFVLRGMKKIIGKYKPKILTEFVPEWIQDQGDDPIEVLREYIRLGYWVKVIGSDAKFYNSAEDIIENIKEGKTWYSNLVLEPIE